MEPQFIVRPASPSDAEALAEFNIAMAKETEGKALDPPTVLAGVRGVFAEPMRGRYFVAAHGDQVVGALLVTREWSDWRAVDYWWIQSVYVRPSARRSGVFSALYRHVARAAQIAGAFSLRLYVEDHNAAAQATYARLGMVDAHYRVMEQVL